MDSFFFTLLATAVALVTAGLWAGMPALMVPPLIVTAAALAVAFGPSVGGRP